MRERVLAVLRALLAVVGTLPSAVLGGLALALFLPVSDDARMAIGFASTIPLWITAMSVVFLDARVWRAALAVALSTAVLALSLGARA